MDGMENIERYWQAVGVISDIIELGTIAYLLNDFVRPFLRKNRYRSLVGAAYFAVMLLLYFIPWEMGGKIAHAAGAFLLFVVMYLIDRRNAEQKLFLSVTFYLLRWISRGVMLLFWNILYERLIMPPAMQQRPLLQLVCFAVVQAVGVTLNFFVLKLLFGLIGRRYVYKEENMTKKELVLLLGPSMSVFVGYWVFAFYDNAYERNFKSCLWEVYPEYDWMKALYQVAAFGSLLAVIVIYQSIRENQREKREAAVLSEQLKDTKRHIHEVEALYRDMRGLKHDMGNHVMVLENLCLKNEQEEAVKYLEQLKEQFHEHLPEIRSGNPVTDVILTEKKREAEEKKIAFVCDFHYPEGTKLDVFDVSVILNNAAANAMEAAAACKDPYVHISSYRRKNAYVIEIRNRFSGELVLDEESGLPVSTKRGGEHGFGLSNIRKAAQKYYGDIAIAQGEGKFILSVMLMVE